MSQETLQVQENGQLIHQHLRQEASELQQRGTAASERPPGRGKQHCGGCTFIMTGTGRG